ESADECRRIEARGAGCRLGGRRLRCRTAWRIALALPWRSARCKIGDLWTARIAAGPSAGAFGMHKIDDRRMHAALVVAVDAALAAQGVGAEADGVRTVVAGEVAVDRGQVGAQPGLRGRQVEGR